MLLGDVSGLDEWSLSWSGLHAAYSYDARDWYVCYSWA
jgi:hypothetical protein